MKSCGTPPANVILLSFEFIRLAEVRGFSYLRFMDLSSESCLQIVKIYFLMQIPSIHFRSQTEFRVLYNYGKSK